MENHEKENIEKRKQTELWRDRAWARAFHFLPDIERIVAHGPSEESDQDVIIGMLALVQGELVYRFYDQMEGI